MSVSYSLVGLSCLSLLLVSTSCTKDEPDLDTTSCSHYAQIIGRTVCGANGYILALASPRDTVVTYNLPAEVAGLVSQAQYRPGAQVPLFLPASFVRIKVGYSLLSPAERTVQICTANVNLAPFNKLTNNGTEIRIICASSASQ